MKELIIGAIPDDFSPEKHIPLGPFCFVGKEDVYPDWENLDFMPDPFTSVDELAEADEKTASFARWKLAELGLQLNEKYGLNYSYRFWSILLYPWLSTLIQATWERQARVNNLLEAYQDEAIKVSLLADDKTWAFTDTTDFIYKGIFNPTYDEWIYSRLIESRLPKAWTATYKTQTDKPPLKENEKRKQETKGLWKAIVSKLFKRTQHIYGMNLPERVFFDLLLRVKPARKKSTTVSIGISSSSDWPDLKWTINLDRLIEQTMPACYYNLHDRIKSMSYQASSGKSNLVSTDLYYNEPVKLISALATEGGENILSVQHGGHNYGSAKMFSFGAEIEFSKGAFITWGWKEQENIKVNALPLPSPLLSKLRRSSCPNENIIMVGTLCNMYSYRMDASPRSQQVISYRRAKTELIYHLKPEVKSRFLYRPYFNKSGTLNDQDYLKKRIPDLRIVEGKLHLQLMKCGLVILDHPGTTWNVVLAANIPTIFYWKPEWFPFCKQAQVFLDKFKDAGLFFESGAEAATQINNIYPNLESWWNQKEIQQLREAWIWHYARNSKTWRREWIKALWEM